MRFGPFGRKAGGAVSVPATIELPAEIYAAKTSGPPMEVVYAAFGRNLVLEAAISAWSVKRAMPGTPVTILTDQPVESPHFDRVVLRSPDGPAGDPKSAKSLKMEAIRSATTPHVLYLDCDTYVMADLRSVFDAPFDIAACHNTWQFSAIYRRFNNGLPEADLAPHLAAVNSGLMFFRRNAVTERLLDSWAGLYRDPRIRHDQFALHQAIHDPALRLLVLPSAFNVRAAEPIQLSGRVRMLHMYSGHDQPDLRQTSVFRADFLNQTEWNRVFTPHDGRLVTVGDDFVTRESFLRDHQLTRQAAAFLHPEIRFAQ